MAEKVRRTKTKYKNIYYNESTKRYDVKYNFKEYDPITQKNRYKAKWKYNLRTISEAKEELAKLQTGKIIPEDKDITLEGIHEVWKFNAESENFSVITLRNTEQQMNMIYQFLPKETKLKNITEEVYRQLIIKCRNKGYSEESLHNINACLRKMLNIAENRGYITQNPLAKVKNIKFDVAKPFEEDSPKIITNKEFEAIDAYFAHNSFYRMGVDRYIGYQLMIETLWFTGIRIGELLALQYNDIRTVKYENGSKISAPIHEVLGKDTDAEGYTGYEIVINKVYLTTGKTTTYAEHIRNKTKNRKNRIVPIPEDLFLMVDRWMFAQGYNKVLPTDRIFDWTQSNSLNMLKTACKEAGIRPLTIHSFRHTFVSKLLVSNKLSIAEIERLSGDCAATLYARYSHSLESMRERFDDVVSTSF